MFLDKLNLDTKELILLIYLLISYILSLYTSNSTTSKQLFNLTLYGSLKYNGNYPSLSILDISGFEDDTIYISYYIERSGFKTKILNYSILLLIYLKSWL